MTRCWLKILKIHATVPMTGQGGKKSVSSHDHKMALISTHHILLGRFLHLWQVSVLDSWRSRHTEVLYTCSSSPSHHTSSIFCMGGKKARQGLFTWRQIGQHLSLSAKLWIQSNWNFLYDSVSKEIGTTDYYQTRPSSHHHTFWVLKNAVC